MLEAKVSVMRNSINFTMVNNKDSVNHGPRKVKSSMENDNGLYEFDDFNFNS